MCSWDLLTNKNNNTNNTNDNWIKDEIGSSKYKLECNFVQLPYLSDFMVPNLNSTLLAFIFTYVIMPMQTYNSYNIICLLQKWYFQSQILFKTKLIN